jgi:ribosomal protein S12 methylthiotransferase accessory factor
LTGSDLSDEIDWCVQMLARLGHDVLLLDTTRADLGFPSVRVVVPGLRSLHRHLAPGRLYDIPVQRGWMPRRLREEELNPDWFGG